MCCVGVGSPYYVTCVRTHNAIKVARPLGVCLCSGAGWAASVRGWPGRGCPGSELNVYMGVFGCGRTIPHGFRVRGGVEGVPKPETR